MEILKYQDWKEEHQTLHLIAQILGKYKLACAYQAPQWEHIVLNITPEGFTTGLLYYGEKYFSISVNVLDDQIEVRVNEDMTTFPLQDGKTIQDYYKQITGTVKEFDIEVEINPEPQEMADKTPFDEDTKHHHYDHDKAVKAVKLLQYANRALERFVHPLRARVEGPGLFWGTFDVSTLVVYNEMYETFKPRQVIEYGCFDERFVEFGFWFGDDNFEGPAFFVLPYPFVDADFTYEGSLPEGAYFSQQLTEFVYELKRGDLDELDTIDETLKRGFEIFTKHQGWEGTSHYTIPLKMPKNNVSDHE